MKGLLLGSSTKCVRAQILVTGRCGLMGKTLNPSKLQFPHL